MEDSSERDYIDYSTLGAITGKDEFTSQTHWIPEEGGWTSYPRFDSNDDFIDTGPHPSPKRRRLSDEHIEGRFEDLNRGLDEVDRTAYQLDRRVRDMDDDFSSRIEDLQEDLSILEKRLTELSDERAKIYLVWADDTENPGYKFIQPFSTLELAEAFVRTFDLDCIIQALYVDDFDPEFSHAFK